MLQIWKLRVLPAVSLALLIIDETSLPLRDLRPLVYVESLILDSAVSELE